MTKDNKAPRKILRLIFSAVAFVLLTAAVVVAIMYLTDSPLLRTQQQETADSFSYDDRGDSVYAELDGGFAVVSKLGIQAFSADEQETIMTTLRIDKPAVSFSGEFAAAYDIGGRTV